MGISVTQETDEYSDTYRSYVLVLLTLVYAFNFIDRQIIGILSPFIQQDLGLTDAQLGWLKGFFFALLYTLVGIPIAWLADRYNRINIITVSLTMWSGFTAVSGLVSSYFQLAMARIGVGIGEAGGSPPSHSIISDLYPKERRATALAIYSLGIPFGIMLAYFASAFFLREGQADWRIVMISVGLPGIALAVLFKLTVREPKRTKVSSQSAGASFSEAIKTLLSIPSWWGMCLGIAFASFGAYAVSAWLIDFVVRTHEGVKITQFLFTLGILNGTAYASGVWAGGALVDKLARKYKEAYALVPVVAISISLPAFLAAFWVDNINLMLVFITIFLFLSGTYLGPSFALAQTLAPVNMRAMSTALFFLILNLIALGGGPTYIGVVSQAMTERLGEVEALRMALTTLFVTYALSIALFYWTSKKINQDWSDAEQRNR